MVKPSYGLTEEDYHRILAESKSLGQQDIQNRLLIESKVKARQLLHHLEEAIKTDGDLLTAPERERLAEAMEALRQCLTDGHPESIVEQRKILESMSTPFATQRVRRFIGQEMRASSAEET